MAAPSSLERGVKVRTLMLFGMLLMPLSAFAALYAVIVEGLGGEPQYTSQFQDQVETLQTASQPLAAGGEVRTLAGAAATREAILAHFRALARTVKRDDRVAVYLIGHGSFDGQEFKFNLPGPDLTGQDLKRLLDGLPTDNQLLVSTGSASGSLADVLKKDSRVLITATRSGNERNATRFGGDFAAAFKDPAADTDRSGSINAQEAFDFAARRVEDFYKRETRIASEHPRIEGSRAARFTVAQLTATPSAAQSANPERQRLAAARDAIQAQIEELRLRKEQMEEVAYLADLEKLLLALAGADEQLDALDDGSGAAQAPASTPGEGTNAP